MMAAVRIVNDDKNSETAVTGCGSSHMETMTDKGKTSPLYFHARTSIIETSKLETYFVVFSIHEMDVPIDRRDSAAAILGLLCLPVACEPFQAVRIGFIPPLNDLPFWRCVGRAKGR